MFISIKFSFTPFLLGIGIYRIARYSLIKKKTEKQKKMYNKYWSLETV